MPSKMSKDQSGFRCQIPVHSSKLTPSVSHYVFFGGSFIMYAGMNRNEVRGLTVLIVIIALGIAVREFRDFRPSERLWASDNVTASANASSPQFTPIETPSPAPTQSSAWVDGRLDLNTATQSDLDMLPMIGKTRAQAILDYRKQNGDFPTVESLGNVPGIGEKTLERLSPSVFVRSPAPQKSDPTPSIPIPSQVSGPRGPTPIPATNPSTSAEPGMIDLNTATALELESLDRIGPVLAQRIVDSRTQNGPFRSVNDLLRVRGIGPKTLERNIDRIMVGATRRAPQ
jgi:competence protein ComEA